MNARIWAVTALLAVVLVALGSQAAATDADPGKVGPPDTMVAMGDGLSTGYQSALAAENSPANSWTIGTDPSVDSHYLRLLALNDAIAGRQRSVAAAGSKAADLVAQADAVVGMVPRREYVTILTGVNDACAPSEAEMTSVAGFRAAVGGALSRLAEGLPNTRIFVASVPDVWKLWDESKDNASARFAWSNSSLCQSLLLRPLSTTLEDSQRRLRVRARVEAYNDELEEACDDQVLCRFDGSAAYDADFTGSDLSTVNWFDLSPQGQAKLANITWAAGFDFEDVDPPSTTIVTSRDPDGFDWYNAPVEITLLVEGESLGSQYDYRLAGAGETATWRPYEGPFSVADEGVTTVEARSIDSNGNVEPAQSRAIRIDMTPPQLALSCPSAPVALGGLGLVTVSASDGGSGFQADPTGSYPLDTSTPGTFTTRMTVSDRAGNATTSSCQFTVTSQTGPGDPGEDPDDPDSPVDPLDPAPPFDPPDGAPPVVTGFETGPWCAVAGNRRQRIGFRFTVSNDSVITLTVERRRSFSRLNWPCPNRRRHRKSPYPRSYDLVATFNRRVDGGVRTFQVGPRGKRRKARRRGARFSVAAGRHRVRMSSLSGAYRLRPGIYRARLIARDPSGRSSAPKTAWFRIQRPVKATP